MLYEVRSNSSFLEVTFLIVIKICLSYGYGQNYITSVGQRQALFYILDVCLTWMAILRRTLNTHYIIHLAMPFTKTKYKPTV